MWLDFGCLGPVPNGQVVNSFKRNFFSKTSAEPKSLPYIMRRRSHSFWRWKKVLTAIKIIIGNNFNIHYHLNFIFLMTLRYWYSRFVFLLTRFHKSLFVLLFFMTSKNSISFYDIRFFAVNLKFKKNKTISIISITIFQEYLHL